MRLAILVILLSIAAHAEKFRLADTNMPHASMWTSWYGCENVTSAAQELADGTQVDTLIVQHRTWWGKRRTVVIVPVEPVVKYDRSEVMKTNTLAQRKAADPQRIVELMQPKPETQAMKYAAPHPHIVCNSWVGPKIKGVIHC